MRRVIRRTDFKRKIPRGIFRGAAYHQVMNNDDQLDQLLRQWKEIEPTADFDAAVWRRIAGTFPEHKPSFADWLRDAVRAWLPRPAFAMAAAVVIGAGIGVASGVFSVAPERGFGFLAPDTLAGGYVRIAAR
jgi:hypothetical protein